MASAVKNVNNATKNVNDLHRLHSWPRRPSAGGKEYDQTQRFPVFLSDFT